MNGVSPRAEPTGQRSAPMPLILVLSAVFVIGVVSAAAVLVVSQRGEGASGSASAPSAPSAPVSGSVNDSGLGYGAPITDPWGRRVEVPVNQYGQVLAQDESKRLKDSDTGWLTEPAKGLQWQLVFNRPVVFSTSDGPSRLDGHVPAGFAHTPQGAVLAAMHTFSCVAARGEGYAEECYDKRVTDGPNFDRARQEAVKAGQLPRQGGPGLPTLPPFSAARVENYAPDYTSIWLAGRDQTTVNEQYVLFRAEALWVDGDWKIKATRGGDNYVEGVKTLEGFTKW